MDRQKLESLVEPLNAALHQFGMHVDELAFIVEGKGFIPVMFDIPATEHWHGTERVFHQGGSYVAHYTWAKLETFLPRIELLYLPDGGSPMHKAFGGGLLHGSFKLKSWHGYYEMLRLLRESDFEMVQMFVAEYGAFSYWRCPGTNAYLKPRVNLRDPNY